jgi:predicted dehydrogenase
MAQGDVHGIIISTEPKAHKPYLLWATERNLDILVDKPITAPVGLTTHLEAAQQVWADYVEIEECLKNSRSNLVVQCQRRSHPGYQFIRSYLSDFCSNCNSHSYLNIFTPMGCGYAA